MKKIVRNTLLGLALLGTSVVADEVKQEQGHTKSLVGIEAGYSSLDYNKANQAIQNVNLSNLGLKIGAETEDFRAFVSARYFYDSSSKYEYLVTYGGELQYKFSPIDLMNFFIGANVGMASMRFDANDGFGPRSLSSPYFGGDLGTNIHLGNTTDLEIGARVMSIQGTHTSATYGDYTIGNIVNVYASLIFKWQMD